MISLTKQFNLLDLQSTNEGEWFEYFNNVQGGPIAKCLILIAISKRELLITPKEGLRFKEFIMMNKDKAQLAIQSFDKDRSLYAFRNEMRGLLGLPRTRNSDSPEIANSKRLAFLNRKPPQYKTSNSREFSPLREGAVLKLKDNSILNRRKSTSPSVQKHCNGMQEINLTRLNTNQERRV